MAQAKILVIDDEPGMLRAVSRILAADYHVLTASAPEEGLAQLQAFKPDMVICDVSMPRMDGFEVMRRAKSQQPGVVELAAFRSDQPPRSGRAPPGQLPMGNWNARELMRRE